MRPRHSSLARWSPLLALLAVCSVADPLTARGQARPPVGTTPGGKIFDRLQEDTTRPTPQTPRPSQPPGADMLWVPGRHVRVPGVEGDVFVPGHWEQRLSDREMRVPPLTGYTPDGRTIQWPAGTQPPPHQRQSP
jgi:hypothetical protein